MAAHPIVAPPLNDKTSVRLVVEEPPVFRNTRTIPSRTVLRPIMAAGGKNWFSEALLEADTTRPQRRAADVLVSVALHFAILATAFSLPLYFTQTINLKQFSATLLIAPPPPPPPPPAPLAVTQAKPAAQRHLLTNGKLLAPVAIPSRIADLREEPLPPEAGMGVVGGVPGGVPGGQLGGVIGGIISDASHAYVPSPTEVSRPRAPIRVGGHVKAPRALFKPPPVYPLLAKQAQMQGIVSIDAVIDTVGDVVEMRVISGSPLLIPAALQAVRQWKYEPSYLNGQPIAVQLTVSVTFQLSQ